MLFENENYVWRMKEKGNDIEMVENKKGESGIEFN
jgi:hypothetical protein